MMKTIFRDRRFYILLSVMVAVLGASIGVAATFTVNATGDSTDINPGDGVAVDGDGMCTLRAAIMEANALYGPDEIVLPEGLFILSIAGYGEDLCAEGDLDIFSNLTIRGAGKDLSIIDANQIDRVFHIRGGWNVTFEDLTIKNGKAETGWSLPEGVFTEETAGMGKHGGGILNINGVLLLERVSLQENIGGRGGDAPYYCGSGGWGGGVFNTGQLTASHCYFYKNVAGRGGGVYGYAYNSLGDDAGNRPQAQRKNPLLMNPAQMITFPGTGGYGGGICNHRGKVVIDECQFEANSGGNGGSGYGYFGGGHGGGLYNLEGEATLRGTSLCKNSGGNGGGYEDAGNGGSGGAIFSESGVMLAENCLVYENKGGDGGWCYATGGSGGGLDLRSSDSKLLNTTISFNSSGSSEMNGYGGGVYQNKGKLEMVFCTVYHNNCGRPSYYGYSDRGGGVYGDNVFVKNSIIYGNRVGNFARGNDFYGTMHSVGYNLLGDPDACTIDGDTTGNILLENPLFRAIADNGGSCMTHALSPGSPAIDSADPQSAVQTDQRGVTRPKDGDNDGSPRSDMGAYEHTFPAAAITAPVPNQQVRGWVTIESDCCDTHWVDFYVDGHKIGTDNEAPFAFEWDTTGYFNGPHRVRAVACDKMGQEAGDEVTLHVDNVLVHCKASRKQDRGWLVRSEAVVVEIALEYRGGAAIDRFSVQRKSGSGEFQDIAQIAPSELEDGSHTYIDLSLDLLDLSGHSQPVSYRIMARESDGSMAGLSNEAAL